MRTPVSLSLRVRAATGGWIYVRPVRLANHRLKALYGVVDGSPKHCPEASYYLRYKMDGKRLRDNVGIDPDAATAALQRKTLELQALAQGIEFPPLVPSAQAMAAEAKPKGRALHDAKVEYILETEAQKSKKTLNAYKQTLTLFMECFRKENLEDIDRKDMLAFVTFLRARQNAPRTVRNRVDYLQIFLHHFGLPSLLKGKDLPTYTDKKVRAYSEADLGKLFGHADQEESDRLYFLLCTGTREQEAQYACWSDIDLDAKTYTVTEHLDLGFKPKDAEEGTIPIPSLLVDVLRLRRQRNPTSRLVFPTSKNEPDGHLLRIIKSLGLRAGLNCGHCTNKAGKSCATQPVCKHLILHKLRKTFASVLNKKGIPPRTIMRYLRHSDLTTTLRYLDDQDDDHTRAIVETAFVIGGAS
jgi:integrase/recombinase XerD